MSRQARERSERTPIPPEVLEFLWDKLSHAIGEYWQRYFEARQRQGFVGDDVRVAFTRDPFRVLGVKPGATAAEVRRRVRELARIFHPDLAGGDADKMTEVNNAAAEILRGLDGAGR